VLGESFVDAVPFAQRATWGPTCRQLDDALGWLTTLGAATRREVPPAIVAATLLALLDRFVATYRPTAAEVAALRSRFEALSSIDGPLPTVLQHGDPGIWNLVVDREGRTVFLDWESAEPDGLPLWDLLYCFRSYAAAASRRAGNRDRVDAAAGVLLDDTPLSERLVAAVADYRVACGLPVEAVDALVFGCWVHRSLKEATRLPAARLADGNYVRLVRRMLDRPDAPTLVRLSGGAA
jgi:aminoglycoside phosphotransferase (APT) family kinase protein